MRTGLNHQVIGLLNEGLSPSEVARKLRVTSAYVRATRRRNGGGMSKPELTLKQLQKQRETLRKSLSQVEMKINLLKS